MVHFTLLKYYNNYGIYQIVQTDFCFLYLRPCYFQIYFFGQHIFTQVIAYFFNGFA